MSLLGRLLPGPPEGATPSTLARILRRGDGARRLRATRELARTGAVASLLPLLADPAPGIRRSAATGIGWAEDPSLTPGLIQAARRERCTSVRVALAVALIRLGEEPGAILEGLVSPRFQSAGGLRCPDQALGLGVSEPRREAEDLLALGAVHAARARLRHSEDPRDLESLGSLAHPEDHATLLALRGRLGRRHDHALLLALGRHGDPRSLPLLLSVLSDVHTDPGRGLAERRLAGLSIGRIGLPDVSGTLLDAMVREEAREGRPGAGMGIQYPVRGALVWALGEVQAPRAVPALACLLQQRSTDALGGLHLQAMGALHKIGEPARTALESIAHSAEPWAAGNARGVLERL